MCYLQENKKKFQWMISLSAAAFALLAINSAVHASCSKKSDSGAFTRYIQVGFSSHAFNLKA